MDALIVSSSKPTMDAIADVVRYCGDYNIIFASSGLAAKQTAAENRPDVVIVAGAADSASLELSIALCDQCDGGVIMICDAAAFEQTLDRVGKSGVIVVPKPISKLTLYTAVNMVRATNVRIERLRSSNADLKKQIEDMKIIGRAKAVLMKNLGYTEAEAHRHIERKAMDLRLTKRNVAMNILKTYET